jgi:transposase-like protein
METKESFDFEALKQEASKGLYTDQSINGEKGIFDPLLKQLLEAALEGEMAAHLDGQERQQGNRRNGKTSKTVKSAAGEFSLSTCPGSVR